MSGLRANCIALSGLRARCIALSGLRARCTALSGLRTSYTHARQTFHWRQLGTTAPTARQPAQYDDTHATAKPTASSTARTSATTSAEQNNTGAIGGRESFDAVRPGTTPPVGSTGRGSGEIGIHAGFRYLCRKA